MMSVNSIAQSSRINISLENKIEVVKTLKTYPLVLDELYLTTDLLVKCNEISGLQESQIVLKNNQINNLNSQIDILDKQNELFKQQLKKSKGSTFKVAAIGVATIVGIILIK